MKKLLLLLIFTTVLSFTILPVTTLAQSTGGTGSTAGEDSAAISRLKNLGVSGGDASVNQNSLAVATGGIIKAFITIVGLIFMLYIVHAGYVWMTAGGNEEKLTKAKGTIRASIIGIIIVFSAYIITSFVVNYFTSAQSATINVESGTNT